MTDYIVANCETAAFNGTYIWGGESDQSHWYLYNGETLIASIEFDPGDESYAGSIIIVDPDFTAAYINFDFNYYTAPDDPLIVWIDGFTSEPSALTVTAAGGGAQNLTLSCATGSYSLAGVACTLTYTPATQNLTLSCGAGSLALTGSACTLSVKRNFALSCSAGSYAVTGTAATLEVKRNYTLACAAGSYALTGTNATFEVKRNYTLACGAGSYAVTGSACTLTALHNYVLSVTQTTPDVVASGAGTTVVNGLYKYFNYGQYFKNDASALVFPFVYGKWYVMGINGGVYYSAIKAVDTPDLVDNWQVETDGTAPVPTFTVSPDVGGAFYLMQGVGSTLTVQRNYTLSASAGSYSLTGSDISFGNTKSYELVCGAGSYSLTGTDCTLSVIHAYSLSCGAGSYAITGTNAALTSARSLACNSGAYTLTGLEADLFKRLVMPCGNGSYILTGSPATINSARTFVLGMGSYVLVGMNAGLYIPTPTPDCRRLRIGREDRRLVINAEDRTLHIPKENRSLEIVCCDENIWRLSNMTDTIRIKDPNALLDWVFPYAKWLSEGETIVDYQLTSTGVEIESDSIDGDEITVWVKGGENGNNASVTCHITTSAGRIDDRTLKLQIKNR